MSETSKSKNIPNKTITCVVYGAENDKLNIKDSNEQPMNIPGIPMEISVDPHSFEIAPNREIIRKREHKIIIRKYGECIRNCNK